MSICQSCGGVIGRDCFNPKECAWIGEQQEQQQLHELQHFQGTHEERIQSLEDRVATLEAMLIPKHNIPKQADGDECPI